MINLRDYEALVIIKPHLEEEEIKKIVSTIEDNIIQRNGELITKTLYEKKKLAYRIDKYTDGYFAFFYYVGSAEITKRIDEVCRFNENILRLANFRLESRDNVLRRLGEPHDIKDKDVEEEEIKIGSYVDEEEEE